MMRTAKPGAEREWVMKVMPGDVAVMDGLPLSLSGW
jgi:hypothetical protein